MSTTGAAEAVVYDAVRTPCGRGRSGGALYGVKPVSLVAGLVGEIRERNPKLDVGRLADLVLGVATPVGDQGGDLARAAALVAGLPDDVGGLVVNRIGASGLEAVNLAAARVRAGDDALLLAGGVESMSRLPAGVDGGPWANDPATNYLTHYVPPGVAADLLATVTGLGRAELDAYAARSRQRATEAWADGRFDQAVVPVRDHGLPVLDHDERVGPIGPGDKVAPERLDAVADFLARLAPAFTQAGEQAGFDAVALRRYHWLERVEHVHTAGNAAGAADGAALVLIGDAQVGAELGLRPLARVVATASAGAEPTLALTGAGAATRKLLTRAGLRVADVDLFEIDESYAAVALAYQRDLDVPDERLNVNGGGIALGHPLGAIGAMLVATAVAELSRRGARRAVVALSAAAGMGVATLLERI
ncbi:acetyl-CoA C-acyltransferase [Frankia sp. AgB1.9]|uniref:acetyl-CoA C-acyltransferase n=1 Tax=unclassified Frankia TaxID=2632575 RepID=UPI001933CCD3|nr:MULTISPECIES: acetyl-CoA C-acyltransferase [unclassified Frankia]MBL7488868.1 acetyl-CoA C-acyltransferase [Frankia sp. AgW1.1]MBL7547604.1 acetyl-CoA C-acyltransferase [Frankia sp. AgB1.9]MBL7621483.1 acetyl-CoA C-acyltransferase [Frankia sp. AgB1.8]